MRIDVGSELITRKLLETIEQRDNKTLKNCYKHVPESKCRVFNDSMDYTTFCKLV